MTTFGALILTLASALGVSPDRNAIAIPPSVWRTAGPETSNVPKILVDPASPQILYSVAEAHLSKSLDGGRHWEDASSGVSSYASVYSIALDPSPSNMLLAGTSLGVYTSTDGAETWKGSTGSGSSCVSDLVIDPTKGGRVYALVCTNTSVDQLIRTDDGAKSWRPVTVPGQPTSLAVSSDSFGTVYLGVYSGGLPQQYGMLRSSDGGQTWTSIGAGFVYVPGIVIDPVRPTTLYAVTDSGVFRSENRGDTWSRRGGGSALSLAVNPVDPSTLYAGAAGGVWKSFDAGQSWRPIGSGFLSCFFVQALAIDPQAVDTVYAGTDGEGLFQTSDGGQTWRRTSDGQPALALGGLAADAVIPGTVYAATHPRGPFESAVAVYRSTDGGARWGDSCPGQFMETISALEAEPGTPGSLYAGTGHCISGVFCVGAVLHSRDGGSSWESLLSTGLVTGLHLDTKRPGTLYAASVGMGVVNLIRTVIRDVLKSTDGGVTWMTVQGNLPDANVLGFQTDPTAPATLYAVVDGSGIFKSANGGKDWTASNAGLNDLSVATLEVDPNRASVLFAGTPSGLFTSPDGAAHWSVTSMTAPVAALTFDPVDPLRLYVGTPQGVFVSADAGSSWTPMNPGLARLNVRYLAIDATGAVLHAATDGGAVFDFPLRRSASVVLPR